MKKRLVVGLSGASGAILCVSLLEAMRKEKDWEVHLVASEAGERVLREETGMNGNDLRGWPSARTTSATSAQPLPAVRSRRKVWRSCRAA